MSLRDLYRSQPIPGKGQGLVAATDISPGTCVLIETPLVTISLITKDKKKVHRSISRQLAALSDDQRRAYLSLSNTYDPDKGKEVGIARTNAIPLGSGAKEAAVFIEASRINHACDHNAQNTWNEKLQVLTIYAIRSITKGDEITLYYLDEYLNRFQRQLQLRAKFGFTCCCALCSVIEGERNVSDRRLDDIQRLYGRTENLSRQISAPLSQLHSVKNLLALLREEGIAGAAEARAYYNAFQVAVSHSDLARATEFAKLAASSRVIAEGQDSPEVQDLSVWAKDPTKHRNYGRSKRWQTSIESAPQGLETEAFENWLWKLPVDTPRELADLRNESAFPGFDCLPGDNDVDMDYFDTSDGFTYRPYRHWCFFAEIVEVNDFLRLQLMVRDRVGHTVPLFFYTDSRGREVPVSSVRQGYTVAVLYAEQHGFMDLSIGLRHESPTSLKIFPISLAGLYELSDRAQKYATTDGAASICHACGKKPETPKKCARCSLFWYCDQTCQAKGWRNMGHKDDCRVLKDPDLQGMLRLNWEVFEDYHRFS